MVARKLVTRLPFVFPIGLSSGHMLITRPRPLLLLRRALELCVPNRGWWMVIIYGLPLPNLLVMLPNASLLICLCPLLFSVSQNSLQHSTAFRRAVSRVAFVGAPPVDDGMNIGPEPEDTCFYCVSRSSFNSQVGVLCGHGRKVYSSYPLLPMGILAIWGRTFRPQ